MIRLLCGALCVGLVVVAGRAADDETVTLKDYKYKVGDRTRITDQDQSIMRSVIIRDETREEKIEKKSKIVMYVSETLAIKEGETKPTRFKRTYEKAEETVDGETTKLPLDGKTVVIEKIGDKYKFTDENGKRLAEGVEEALDKEFKKKKTDPADDYIPKRPLKVGESWKLNTEKMVKDVVTDKFIADKRRATGSGTLTRAYLFDGRKYGGFEIKLDIPITEMTDPIKIKLKPGSAMSMHMLAEGNVDGTEPDGVAMMRMSMLMLFEVPGGAEASIRVDGVLTMTTEALPPRKRD
ncbi:MAG: hypothetical protein L0241_19240 [Planctomycetia bacterium]|nr:hypothetical protein [Planctomycetia bacterium]